MPIRKVIGPDNPILRKKAKAVGNPADPTLQHLIDDMIETMREAPGVGLAAPQVAVSQRVAVVEYAPDSETAERPEGAEPPRTPAQPKLYVIINPEITARSEEMEDGAEGCLSIPGYYGNVLRHKAVTVRALNRKGKPIRIKAQGWLARIFQHEIDHLDGVLFIDRASQVWKARPEDDQPDSPPV
jgi:peptide deformylase